MDEDFFDSDETLRQIIDDLGVELSPVKPKEVMRVIDDREFYEDAVIENIFREIRKFGKAKSKRETTITIGLGEELDDGPKWELEWLARMIKLDLLRRLCEKDILNYKEGTRLFPGDGSFNEATAVITCIPQVFVNWYGIDKLASERLGDIMAFNRELAFALNSVTAAIYYLQIVDWYHDEEKDSDGYITKTIDEIKRGTSLTKSQQNTAKAVLMGDWLDIQEGKYGFHINRFKPLKPVSIDRNVADALRQVSRARSEKISRLDGLYAELDAVEMSISENPAGELQKYENKATGELPAMDAKGKSKFSKKGDDIWQRKGFERFADDYKLELGYAQFKADIRRKHELERKINELMKSLK